MAKPKGLNALIRRLRAEQKKLAVVRDALREVESDAKELLADSVDAEESLEAAIDAAIDALSKLQ